MSWWVFISNIIIIYIHSKRVYIHSSGESDINFIKVGVKIALYDFTRAIWMFSKRTGKQGWSMAGKKIIEKTLYSLWCKNLNFVGCVNERGIVLFGSWD